MNPGTIRHKDWLQALRFESLAHSATMAEHLRTVDEAQERVARLDSLLEELVPESEQYRLIMALQAMRGVRLFTAATVALEVGGFLRFEHPRYLMGYTGLVPTERSSNDRRRQGGYHSDRQCPLTPYSRRGRMELSLFTKGWTTVEEATVGRITRGDKLVVEGPDPFAYTLPGAHEARPTAEQSHRCGGTRTDSFHVGHCASSRCRGGGACEATPRPLIRYCGMNATADMRSGFSPRSA
jgi:hypothetical protein